MKKWCPTCSLLAVEVIQTEVDGREQDFAEATKKYIDHKVERHGRDRDELERIMGVENTP